MLVMGMVALGPISIDMYLPAFDTIERDLAADGVEMTLSAFLIGLAISPLIYGPLSDRFGRKRPLYIGYLMYVTGSAVCAVCTSMPTLLLARVVQAAGVGAGSVIATAIIRDRCEPDEAARMLSNMGSIMALAPILAPVLGGAFVSFSGWRSIFLVQAGLGLAILAAIHRLLLDTAPHVASPLTVGGMLRGYMRLLGYRGLLGYSFLGGGYMGATFAYIGGAPIPLTRIYGVSPEVLGVLIGLNGAVIIVASQLNIAALRKHSAASILARYAFVPLIIAAVGCVVAALWTLPLWAVVVFQLAFFGTVARVMVNIIAVALGPHGNAAGSAAALMSTVHALLPMTSGIVVAASGDGTIFPVLGVMAGSSLLAVGGYLFARSSGRNDAAVELRHD